MVRLRACPISASQIPAETTSACLKVTVNDPISVISSARLFARTCSCTAAQNVEELQYVYIYIYMRIPRFDWKRPPGEGFEDPKKRINRFQVRMSISFWLLHRHSSHLQRW